MRASDLAVAMAAIVALFMAIEDRSRVTVAPPEAAPRHHAGLLTCPLRQPDFATVMQAAFLGDGALIVEQQTATRVHDLKDC
ncbi:hypothetical protein [Ancylobacter terrae]|uniref:hypothetical protein n=1 Tax=Ancylobacter sp. sgz301288 TaxID=3342077 RepID=UPI00385FFF1C